jgi:hypothetical protein
MVVLLCLDDRHVSQLQPCCMRSGCSATTAAFLYLRDRSCLLRCSLLLNALLQNWHLYFFSAGPIFRPEAGVAVGELPAGVAVAVICDIV